jgi:phosphotransferase system HPr-like phosphotransfer protein
MNLTEGSLTSWVELCRQFMANIESTYARSGNEVDLHVVQQHPGESRVELCRQFMANIESTYARSGNEVDLHVVQKHPVESL